MGALRLDTGSWRAMEGWGWEQEHKCKVSPGSMGTSRAQSLRCPQHPAQYICVPRALTVKWETGEWKGVCFKGQWLLVTALSLALVQYTEGIFCIPYTLYTLHLIAYTLRYT